MWDLQAHSMHATVDELASSLANVKMAMSSEKREEVIALVSKLLQEAKEVHICHAAQIICFLP